MTTILEELNVILTPVLPVETGLFSATAPDAYLVLTPLADSFDLFADNRPLVDVAEVQISIFTKHNYLTIKKQITKLLLANEFTITDRRYLGYEEEIITITPSMFPRPMNLKARLIELSVELYDSQHPQAAKWLLPDGTVTYKLPISGGGNGGTDNHALLDNLGYAESGHTGFASQAELDDLAAKAPATSTVVFHEFAPGLRINRTNYGNVYHYWIEGEASAPRTFAEGAYIATPTQFPELAQFQGGRLTVFAFAYRFPIEVGAGSVQCEFTAFTITKKGISVTPIVGTHFNCIDGDLNYHGGNYVAFSQTLVLGTPN